MKRLLCILIAAAAAFMLTACGSAAPEAGGDTVQTAETEYDASMNLSALIPA